MEAEQQLIDQYLALNTAEYERAANPLRCHGPDHHFRVCQTALQLADAYPQTDRRILIIAALLHDLAAYEPDTVQDNYHEEDRIRAGRLLVATDISDKDSKRVLEAIERHGSDPEFQSKDEPIEVTILRDADKLDSFGPIGVSRIIMARTRRGDTIAQIVDKFLTHGKLAQKWDSVKLPEARKIGAPLYEYACDFFTALQHQLESNHEHQ